MHLSLLTTYLTSGYFHYGNYIFPTQPVHYLALCHIFWQLPDVVTFWLSHYYSFSPEICWNSQETSLTSSIKKKKQQHTVSLCSRIYIDSCVRKTNVYGLPWWVILVVETFANSLGNNDMRQGSSLSVSLWLKKLNAACFPQNLSPVMWTV